MKKLGKIALAVAMGLSMTACSSGTAKKDKSDVKIGVIQYTEHPALDKAYDGFVKQMKKAGYKKSQIDFKNAQNDQSNCETIANKFVNDGDDLIYAIATPAAQAVKGKTDDIPIVISAVTDPKAAGLVQSNKKPGENVTGTSDLNPVEEQIELLQKLIPNAKKVGIMYCSSEDNSIVQAKLARKAIEKVGMEAQDFTVSETNQIQQVAESMVGKVDAVYIPTDNMLAESISSVTSVTNENNLPCIVGESNMCEGGGLATYSIDYEKLGEQAGKMAVKILNGADPATMKIQYQSTDDLQLYINRKVATQLGITIPDEYQDATDIGE